MIEMNEQAKLNLRLTFLLSLGYFSNFMARTLYNAQVPITLFEYLGSYGYVGFWMAIFSITSIVIIPIMGSVSDNTRTKYGRRMPFLIVGIPVSAIFFVLISTINPSTDPLWLLLLYMFFFNVAMACFRAQAIALMPDFTKPVHRSKGSAIFYFMAGFGSIVAYILNYILIPINLTLAFLTIAVLMLFCLIIMMYTVKEKDSYSYRQILEMEKNGEKIKRKEGPFQSLIDSFREIATSKDKSVFALLLGIILCFCGWSALNALSSVYFADVLGMERGMAGTMLIFISISYIIMTIPSGILATKIGRRLTIKIGLIITAFGIILGYLFQTPTMIIIGFIIAGIGFSFVTIHNIVILWELVPSQKRTGTYSGIYFLAVFIGSIFGPIIVGFITDFLGNVTFFLIISIFFLADLVCMFFVKRGEAGDAEVPAEIN